MEPSDGDLLRAARDGDEGAFHALVDRHATALFQVAFSFTRGHRADAEDLVQDTLIAAYRGAKSYAGRASVRTWLLHILTNNASRAWKRGRYRRATGSLEQVVHDPALTRTGQKESADQRMDIAQVIAELSEMHREVLVMREVWGFSYDEIAAALDVPRGTVESRLSRARAAFREKWDTK